MKKKIELNNQQMKKFDETMKLCIDLMGITPMPEVYTWIESFEDFTYWLNDVGMTVKGLPNWQPGKGIRAAIKSDSPHAIWIKSISRRELRKWQRMVQRGKTELSFKPVSDLDSWIKLDIVNIDFSLLKKNGRKYF